MDASVFVRYEWALLFVALLAFAVREYVAMARWQKRQRQSREKVPDASPASDGADEPR